MGNMQIFVKTHRETVARTVAADLSIKQLRDELMERHGLYISSIYGGSERVCEAFMDGQTILAVLAMLGGGNMTEGNKLISLNALEMKICRKCYARNAIKATRCRKS